MPRFAVHARFRVAIPQGGRAGRDDPDLGPEPLDHVTEQQVADLTVCVPGE